MSKNYRSFGGAVDSSSLKENEKEFRQDMSLIENPKRQASIKSIILQGIANSGLYSSCGQFTHKNELMVAVVKEMVLKGDSEDATPQDQKNVAMLMERILPPLKASVDAVKLEGYNKGATHAQRAELVMDAIMNGELSADIGKIMIDNIKSVAEICDLQDVLERLEALEND